MRGAGVEVGRTRVAVGLGLGVGVIVGVGVTVGVAVTRTTQGVGVGSAVTRTTQGVAVGFEACASLIFILASTVASIPRSWASRASTVASMSVLEQATNAISTTSASDMEDR